MSPRILVVESDPDTREALIGVLEEEGYAVEQAATPAAALALIEEHTFNAVLTDLFAELGGDKLDTAVQLAQAVAPSPVGVLSGWQVDEAEARRRGLAFVLQKPLEVELVSARVSGAVSTALAADAQEVRLATAYFAALGAHDWDGLLELCIEDVTYSLPGEGLFARTLHGREELRRYSEETFALFPPVTFADVIVHRTPLGMAARYASQWTGDEGKQHRQSGTVAFHLAGERIRAMVIRLSDERLQRYAAMVGKRSAV